MNLKYPYGNERKKVRGIRRKLKSLENRFIEITKDFPSPYKEREYWNTSVPDREDFIDSRNTPISVRRKLIQIMLDRVSHLIEIKPDDSNSRVFALIDVPNLWWSSIEIFYSEDYFKTFFNRHSDYEKWTPLPDSRDFSKDWNIKLPENLKVKGYLAEYYDEEDGTKRSFEIWAIGEIK